MDLRMAGMLPISSCSALEEEGVKAPQFQRIQVAAGDALAKG
jgi:hypothetical protein